MSELVTRLRPTMAFVLAMLAPAACMARDSDGAGQEERPAAQAPDPPPQRPERGERTPVAPAEMFGQWRLAELTGVPPAEAPGLHVLIGEHRIEARSQCIPFAFTLALENGAATVSEQPWGAPVCARGRTPVEAAFPAVMTAARRIERRPGGRLAFVGARGEAVFERPQAPVANPFAEVPGPVPWLMWGEWRVEAIDGAPLPAGQPIRLLFYAREIEARSGCVAMGWSYGQDGANLTVGRESWPHPVCERSRSPAERALEAIMAGEVRIGRASPNERLLVGGQGTLLLRR
ncbi:MAG TPA: hypothetical protein VN231_15220 [Allosphingosinicella sp.]|nr:hypothetical protein [Allosphingosinicella sp.]